MNIVTKILRSLREVPDDSSDVLATLLMAAREDQELRGRILSLLRVPQAQREALVNTALHEMRLRNEPETACAAFATLATEEGANAAWRVLHE